MTANMVTRDAQMMHKLLIYCFTVLNNKLKFQNMKLLNGLNGFIKHACAIGSLSIAYYAIDWI